MTIILALISAIVLLLGVILLAISQQKNKRAQMLLNEAKFKWDSLKKEIEHEKKEALLKLKDEIYKRKTDFELEIKKEKSEVERFQQKIQDKYDTIEKKDQRLEELRRELQQKERIISRTSDMLRVNEQKLKTLYDELLNKLENISNMNREEARQALFKMLESEVKLSNEKYIQKVEDDARQEAKEKAIQIIVGAIQRYTADQVSTTSSGVVHLPNDEMKGRIIGKEGRNINL